MNKKEKREFKKKQKRGRRRCCSCLISCCMFVFVIIAAGCGVGYYFANDYLQKNFDVSFKEAVGVIGSLYEGDRDKIVTNAPSKEDEQALYDEIGDILLFKDGTINEESLAPIIDTLKDGMSEETGQSNVAIRLAGEGDIESALVNLVSKDNIDPVKIAKFTDEYDFNLSYEEDFVATLTDKQLMALVLSLLDEVLPKDNPVVDKVSIDQLIISRSADDKPTVTITVSVKTKELVSNFASGEVPDELMKVIDRIIPSEIFASATIIIGEENHSATFNINGMSKQKHDALMKVATGALKMSGIEKDAQTYLDELVNQYAKEYIALADEYLHFSENIGADGSIKLDVYNLLSSVLFKEKDITGSDLALVYASVMSSDTDKMLDQNQEHLFENKYLVLENGEYKEVYAVEKPSDDAELINYGDRFMEELTAKYLIRTSFYRQDGSDKIYLQPAYAYGADTVYTTKELEEMYESNKGVLNSKNPPETLYLSEEGKLSTTNANGTDKVLTILPKVTLGFEDMIALMGVGESDKIAGVDLMSLFDPTGLKKEIYEIDGEIPADQEDWFINQDGDKLAFDVDEKMLGALVQSQMGNLLTEDNELIKSVKLQFTALSTSDKEEEIPLTDESGAPTGDTIKVVRKFLAVGLTADVSALVGDNELVSAVLGEKVGLIVKIEITPALEEKYLTAPTLYYSDLSANRTNDILEIIEKTELVPFDVNEINDMVGKPIRDALKTMEDTIGKITINAGSIAIPDVFSLVSSFMFEDGEITGEDVSLVFGYILGSDIDNMIEQNKAHLFEDKWLVNGDEIYSIEKPSDDAELINYSDRFMEELTAKYLIRTSFYRQDGSDKIYLQPAYAYGADTVYTIKELKAMHEGNASVLDEENLPETLYLSEEGKLSTSSTNGTDKVLTILPKVTLGFEDIVALMGVGESDKIANLDLMSLFDPTGLKKEIYKIDGEIPSDENYWFINQDGEKLTFNFDEKMLGVLVKSQMDTLLTEDNDLVKSLELRFTALSSSTTEETIDLTDESGNLTGTQIKVKRSYLTIGFTAKVSALVGDNEMLTALLGDEVGLIVKLEITPELEEKYLGEPTIYYSDLTEEETDEVLNLLKKTEMLPFNLDELNDMVGKPIREVIKTMEDTLGSVSIETGAIKMPDVFSLVSSFMFEDGDIDRDEIVEVFGYILGADPDNMIEQNKAHLFENKWLVDGEEIYSVTEIEGAIPIDYSDRFMEELTAKYLIRTSFYRQDGSDKIYLQPAYAYGADTVYTIKELKAMHEGNASVLDEENLPETLYLSEDGKLSTTNANGTDKVLTILPKVTLGFDDIVALMGVGESDKIANLDLMSLFDPTGLKKEIYKIDGEIPSDENYWFINQDGEKLTFNFDEKMLGVLVKSQMDTLLTEDNDLVKSLELRFTALSSSTTEETIDLTDESGNLTGTQIKVKRSYLTIGFTAKVSALVGDNEMLTALLGDEVGLIVKLEITPELEEKYLGEPTIYYSDLTEEETDEVLNLLKKTEMLPFNLDELNDMVGKPIRDVITKMEDTLGSVSIETGAIKMPDVFSLVSSFMFEDGDIDRDEIVEVFGYILGADPDEMIEQNKAHLFEDKWLVNGEEIYSIEKPTDEATKIEYEDEFMKEISGKYLIRTSFYRQDGSDKVYLEPAYYCEERSIVYSTNDLKGMHENNKNVLDVEEPASILYLSDKGELFTTNVNGTCIEISILPKVTLDFEDIVALMGVGESDKIANLDLMSLFDPTGLKKEIYQIDGEIPSDKNYWFVNQDGDKLTFNFDEKMLGVLVKSQMDTLLTEDNDLVKSLELRFTALSSSTTEETIDLTDESGNLTGTQIKVKRSYLTIGFTAKSSALVGDNEMLTALLGDKIGLTIKLEITPELEEKYLGEPTIYYSDLTEEETDEVLNLLKKTEMLPFNLDELNDMIGKPIREVITKMEDTLGSVSIETGAIKMPDVFSLVSSFMFEDGTVTRDEVAEAFGLIVGSDADDMLEQNGSHMFEDKWLVLENGEYKEIYSIEKPMDEATKIKYEDEFMKEISGKYLIRTSFYRQNGSDNVYFEPAYAYGADTVYTIKELKAMHEGNASVLDEENLPETLYLSVATNEISLTRRNGTDHELTILPKVTLGFEDIVALMGVGESDKIANLDLFTLFDPSGLRKEVYATDGAIPSDKDKWFVNQDGEKLNFNFDEKMLGVLVKSQMDTLLTEDSDLVRSLELKFTALSASNNTEEVPLTDESGAPTGESVEVVRSYLAIGFIADVNTLLGDDETFTALLGDKIGLIVRIEITPDLEEKYLAAPTLYYNDLNEDETSSVMDFLKKADFSQFDETQINDTVGKPIRDVIKTMEETFGSVTVKTGVIDVPNVFTIIASNMFEDGSVTADEVATVFGHIVNADVDNMIKQNEEHLFEDKWLVLENGEYKEVYSVTEIDGADKINYEDEFMKELSGKYLIRDSFYRQNGSDKVYLEPAYSEEETGTIYTTEDLKNMHYGNSDILNVATPYDTLYLSTDQILKTTQENGTDRKITILPKVKLEFEDMAALMGVGESDKLNGVELFSLFDPSGLRKELYKIDGEEPTDRNKWFVYQEGSDLTFNFDEKMLAVLIQSQMDTLITGDNDLVKALKLRYVALSTSDTKEEVNLTDESGTLTGESVEVVRSYLAIGFTADVSKVVGDDELFTELMGEQFGLTVRLEITPELQDKYLAEPVLFYSDLNEDETVEVLNFMEKANLSQFDVEQINAMVGDPIRNVIKTMESTLGAVTVKTGAMEVPDVFTLLEMRLFNEEKTVNGEVLDITADEIHDMLKGLYDLPEIQVVEDTAMVTGESHFITNGNGAIDGTQYEGVYNDTAFLPSDLHGTSIMHNSTPEYARRLNYLLHGNVPALNSLGLAVNDDLGNVVGYYDSEQVGVDYKFLTFEYEIGKYLEGANSSASLLNMNKVYATFRIDKEYMIDASGNETTDANQAVMYKTTLIINTMSATQRDELLDIMLYFAEEPAKTQTTFIELEAEIGALALTLDRNAIVNTYIKTGTVFGSEILPAL